MSDSNASRLFDMMHINEIISIFLDEKDIHFLKSFYNSLTAKNRFVIKCNTSVNKSPVWHIESATNTKST